MVSASTLVLCKGIMDVDSHYGEGALKPFMSAHESNYADLCAFVKQKYTRGVIVMKKY